MTVTLQDVSMILALPIRGQPVCVSSDSTDWREHMTHMIGTALMKEGVSAGASYPWIQENFNKCPNDANDEVIQRYARAYLWYVVSRVLFSDATGTNAAFCGSSFLLDGSSILVGEQLHSPTCTARYYTAELSLFSLSHAIY
jgi:hypothetical protein